MPYDECAFARYEITRSPWSVRLEVGIRLKLDVVFCHCEFMFH